MNKKILLLDDDDTNRAYIASQIMAKSQYSVAHATDLAAALQECALSLRRSEPFSYLLVDVSLGEHVGGSPNENGIEAINAIVGEIPSIKSIAYSAKIGVEVEMRARRAGAYRYFYSQDLHKVVGDTLASLDELAEIENEIGRLRRQGNPLFAIVESLDIGVSFFDTQGVIWYMNKWNKVYADLPRLPHTCCWYGCHRFAHRATWCPDCAVHLAVKNGTAQRTTALLPIHGTLHRVSLSATPLRSSREPARIIGASEAVVDVTSEWEATPAQSRIDDILSSLSRFEFRQPVRSGLKIEHNLVPYDTVRLFTIVGERKLIIGNRSSAPAEQTAFQRWHARLGDTALRDYAPVLETHTPLVFHAASCFCPNGPIAWRGIVPLITSASQGGDVVGILEIARSDPEIQLDELADFQAYYDCLAQMTIQSLKETDEARRSLLDQGIRELTKQAITLHNANELFRVAGECLEKCFRQVTWHFRTLNRRRKGLTILRSPGLGRGVYWELADELRPLYGTVQADADAVLKRKPLWEFAPDVKSILKGISDTSVSEEQMDALARVRSYATLPLEKEGVALGTLNVQFQDNALDFQSTREFLLSLQAVISDSLSRLNRRALRLRQESFLNDLDLSRCFECQGESANDMEKRLIGKGMSAIYEVTGADIVYFRRCDFRASVAVLDNELIIGTVPKSCSIAKQLPTAAGVSGEVLRTGHGLFCGDVSLLPPNNWHQEALRLLESPSEKAFLKSFRCAIGHPLRIAGELKGVMIALAEVPSILNDDDFAFAGEVCARLSALLTNFMALREQEERIRSLSALTRVKLEMTSIRNEEQCLRLALFAFTDGSCFGFSRAILFLVNGAGNALEGYMAVGALRRQDAELIWSNLKNADLESRLSPFLKGSLVSCELEDSTKQISLAVGEEATLWATFTNGDVLVRQPGHPHFVQNATLCELLADAAYAGVPLLAGGQPLGYVFLDRSWLPSPAIDTSLLKALKIFADETALLIRRLDADRARTEAERIIGRGFGHSLQSRLGLVEASVNLLELKLQPGHEHKETFSDLRRSLEFLKRTGELFRKILLVSSARPATPVDLNPLLADLVRLYSNTDKRIHYTSRCDTAVALGDAVALEDAFSQIIENARNFAPQTNGSITVVLSSESRSWIVEIADNGPGIHPSMRTSLFQAFARFPNNRLGLGLYLVWMTIVKIHGGTVEEVGSPGQGACFRITLPHVNP